MHTLRRAVSNRIRTLQATRDSSLRSLSLNRYISLAVYKLRNLNEREQLEQFFGGLVRDFTQSGAKHEADRLASTPMFLRLLKSTRTYSMELNPKFRM